MGDYIGERPSAHVRDAGAERAIARYGSNPRSLLGHDIDEKPRLHRPKICNIEDIICPHWDDQLPGTSPSRGSLRFRYRPLFLIRRARSARPATLGLPDQSVMRVVLTSLQL